ncbi:NAD(P)/FAD-dependent oxidoreductase [Algibacter lectus]|uniref:3-phenylpropionate/trans-cinnamate dioxygenase ferredoxin reductase subunit n=1 Tax=Algibacter lectus TaxID=221126 RepID=A0A4R8MGW1_9FLAO|nr:FAD-dependent oxidoreductase [Algibacter lectus]MWW25319.1 pyridine nucleotide-disulfide oxidoreductase [Algibacter lectus]TDY64268.1 3-phenylpropionate/trans-cinnamate dioxygenase ferredoxin reductase subunit [Algibacter lectus]
MSSTTQNKVCIVIGASHAGVNFAFALRREGWEGEIILYDNDKEFPYHRPPLSKAYLTSEEGTEQSLLFPKENYKTDNIVLKLGIAVNTINKEEKTITLANGSVQQYDKLVIATGARPFIPPIQGLDLAKNVFPMRTAEDAINIRKTINNSLTKRAVIIGGGYIGLETAASLKKLVANVVVLEREERVLARVTAPVMSDFFTQLHQNNGVKVLTSKNVISIENKDDHNVVVCDDGTKFHADLIVVGVGIKVNSELAQNAGIVIENGIKVDETAKTNDPDIYAIGDCTYHYNPHYKYYLRLESVQNAVDQAKAAAKAICEQEVVYDTIPWFWSDQFDVKLQIVGLSKGYNQIIIRQEEAENSFSAWYFKDDELLAVDAVNFAKAYVLGTKFIKSKQKLDKSKISDLSIPFKPNSFLA